MIFKTGYINGPICDGGKMERPKDIAKQSYLVAATVSRAQAVLYEEYINIKSKCPEYPIKWVRSKSELRYIDKNTGMPFLIKHGVSLHQVLNSLDGQAVDEWAFDYTVSKWKSTDEIAQAVRILQESFDLNDYDRRMKMLLGGTND